MAFINKNNKLTDWPMSTKTEQVYGWRISDRRLHSKHFTTLSNERKINAFDTYSAECSQWIQERVPLEKFAQKYVCSPTYIPTRKILAWKNYHAVKAPRDKIQPYKIHTRKIFILKSYNEVSIFRRHKFSLIAFEWLVFKRL